MKQAGIIVLDKAAGLSSAAALAQLKRRLKIEKIGHAGTLDPMATGVLVCVLNSATRLAQYATDGEKIYSGIFRFGLVTDSDDITGAVIEEKSVSVSFADVEAAAATFVGRQMQIPPRVSALKVEGKRSYKLARQGSKHELAAREVTISQCSVFPLNENSCRFLVRCGAGTYIRSIARDMGEKLGVGGCLAELRREASSPFQIDQAKTLEQIGIDDVLDWRMLFPGALELRLDASDLRALSYGDSGLVSRLLVAHRADFSALPRFVVCVDGRTSNPLALLENRQGSWKFVMNLAVPGEESLSELSSGRVAGERMLEGES